MKSLSQRRLLKWKSTSMIKRTVCGMSFKEITIFLTLPPGTNDRPIGVWAQAHKRYLLNYHKIRYTNLLTSCKLHSYLADIEERAQAMYESIIYETAKREGVTEHLKANDMMAWVGRMNNIQARAREIVNSEVIFCEQIYHM